MQPSIRLKQFQAEPVALAKKRLFALAKNLNKFSWFKNVGYTDVILDQILQVFQVFVSTPAELARSASYNKSFARIAGA